MVAIHKVSDWYAYRSSRKTGPMRLRWSFFRAEHPIVVGLYN